MNSNNSLTSKRKTLNPFSLPTKFKTKVGNTEVLVKGQTLDADTNRYMLYIPKADSESDYSMALITWNRAKYDVPDVHLYDVHIDKNPQNNNRQFIRYMLNANKQGIIAIVAEYDAWRAEQVNSVDIFESLGAEDVLGESEETEETVESEDLAI